MVILIIFIFFKYVNKNINMTHINICNIVFFFFFFQDGSHGNGLLVQLIKKGRKRKR